MGWMEACGVVDSHPLPTLHHDLDHSLNLGRRSDADDLGAQSHSKMMIDRLNVPRCLISPAIPMRGFPLKCLHRFVARANIRVPQWLDSPTSMSLCVERHGARYCRK